MSAYSFLHCTSGRSWSTDDPHTWLLDHCDDELLAAARERLVLSSEDPERCLRAATRRCGLALVRVVAEDKLVLQHWGDPAPDLRRWAKENGFNRPGVQVVFVNGKNNKVGVQENAEDVLMYGQRVGPEFLWSAYRAKYEMRHIEEADDQDAAPAAFTNFVWEKCPNERLTWRVLKAIWRAEAVPCPNCDVPLITTSFGWHQGMLSFRPARLARHCLWCRRQFQAAEAEPLAWVASVLPPGLRPTHLQQWRRFEINWPRLAFKHERPVQVADREG